MTERSFQPFADAAAVAMVGGLSVENGTDHVLIHGDVELTRDRRGLARAQELAALLDGIVRALQAEPGLLDVVASAGSSLARVRNPFA